MEDRPLISYVVTAYNIEHYIEEAVRCAFSQTYSPLEIVLSDDCSTDRTFDIMKKMAADYRGPHVIILNRNTQNLGITRHMNKAYLELAKGVIIIAAHGDDLSEPNRTERAYEYFLRFPNMTALSFSLDAIDDKGIFLKQHSAVVNSVVEYTFSRGGNIPAPSRAFYKRVMEVFGPLSDDCPTEDELISFRALLLGENRFFPEHMVKYRKHSGSSSNPENFSKFPLDRILAQQDKDMRKAVALGLITEKQRIEKYNQLKSGKEIRQKYRKYFSSRSLSDLMSLVLFNKVSFRMKIHYLKAHVEWLMQNEQEEKHL